MLFPTLSVSVLGFAAGVLSAPHLHSRHEIAARDPAQRAERGLTWTPSKRQNGFNAFNSFGSFNNVNNVNFIQDFNQFSQATTVVIAEIQQNSLNQQQLLLEQQLSQLIQQQLFALQSQNFILDNIRRNHFNSRNSNVNTIILICQQVLDNRGGNNNNRWFTRQIQSNPNVQEQVVVVIQDNNVLNLGENFGGNAFIPSSTEQFAAQASGGASFGAPVFGTYQPNSSVFQGFTPNIALLPVGVQQPQFGFGQVGVDPALIILENQPVFISFGQQQQQVIDAQILNLQPFAASSVGGNTLII